MHFDASLDDAGTILNTMYAVAATGPVTDADRASIVATARYIFRLDMTPSLAGVTPVRAEELRALAAKPDLAAEAVRFATVTAFVDGKLDNAKLKAVLRIAAALGIGEDFVDDVKALAQSQLRDAIAHMIRANMESITRQTRTADNIMPWFMLHGGADTNPALAARFRALGDLPAHTFGHAFAAFYQKNKYAFPGEDKALNFAFATPHDSSHVLAGYDTSPRGELLVSTLTAAMLPSHAMAGHVLPLILSWHLGIALDEVTGAAQSALEPEEFWHAWIRGQGMKVDLFGPSWDFWAASREPIETVRAQIGLCP